jgi:hypothetical protein
MPAGHQIDPRMRVQGVQQGDVGFPGYAEGAVYAARGEGIEENFGGGFGVSHASGIAPKDCHGC